MKPLKAYNISALAITLLLAIIFYGPLPSYSQNGEENTVGEGMEVIKSARDKAGPTPGPEGEAASGAEAPAGESASGADTSADKSMEERASAIQPVAGDRPPYDPAGKRDPFKPFIKLVDIPAAGPAPVVVPPIQRYSLDQFRISGIVWMSGKPRAMVVDPEGNTYFLGDGDRIGNKEGEILEVRENGLLVEETIRSEDVYGEAKIETKKSILAFEDGQ
ncbi:MAG: pilus assembly protein PilP [Candidatus Dadabacteria bacterium]|nr:pilus assembly protein PilP [Candidatus Dadabacteria bacterium]